MRQLNYSTTQLPKDFAKRFGVSPFDLTQAKRRKIEGDSRKEQRKAARIEKRKSRVPTKGYRFKKRSLDHFDIKARAKTSSDLPKSVATTGIQITVHKPKLRPSKINPDTLPNQDDNLSYNQSSEPSARVSKSVKVQLAQDDAEIGALERALGVKDKRGFSKSFVADGLDYLLDGLDEIESSDQGPLSKRTREGGPVWLEQKRRKIQHSDSLSSSSNSEQSSGFEGFGNDDDQVTRDFKNGDIPSSPKHTDERFISGSSYLDAAQNQSRRQTRENPYVAPLVAPIGGTPKYVPPSLRIQNGSIEESSRLRRQLKGLLNRLSEATLLSIIDDIERLYSNYAPGLLTTVIIDVLMSLVGEPGPLQDTFIILHAGFIAALFRVFGANFGAHVISRIDEKVKRLSQDAQHFSEGGKGVTNLISLMAELYIFQVISSNLIFDYIRLFLSELSENNTELLLRIFRIAGHQLRQEDPSSLNEIVDLLHQSSGNMGRGSLSVRTKFMIESIDNLKNDKMKTGMAAASVAYEHTISMKKVLGKLHQRSFGAPDPLQIGLRDVRCKDKENNWWHIGTSRREDNFNAISRSISNIDVNCEPSKKVSMIEHTSDLAQLAAEQRMNTDIRRSIFIAIMSANDFNDAYLRLMRLRLKKNQELEIPKVLMQCTGAENSYNLFYTLLSKRLCLDRRVKMAFQFSLWDLFKSIGEGDSEYDESKDSTTDDKLEVRTIANVARMFGALIADGCLSLRVLKNLNLAYLQPKVSLFVEILLATVILETQKSTAKKRNENFLVEVFIRPKEMADMASSLAFFLKKVVRKSDVACRNQDQDALKWGCKVACDALATFENNHISSK